MPISPSDFQFTLSPDPIQAVIGFTTTAQLNFSNTSLVDKAYNLSVTVTLPDGVSFVSSDVVPTQIVNNPDGTITLSWINLKDLAPNELNYQLGLTLKSDDTFRATGLPVPFDTPLVAVNAAATVDTLPRGNDDPGNVKITKTDSSNFIPLRYNLTKSGPGKMPKGAGLLSPVTAPRWPYTYTLTVQNNTRLPSTVTLVDTLPNGIRYLDALTVSGPDAVALSAPVVTAPPVQNFATLNWGTVTLSPLSTNIITFSVAIWDNYTVGGVENSGARITHQTPLQNSATLNGASGPVTATKTTNAMDATIDKSVSSSTTDVGVINNYTLVYKINQYDNVNNVTITDTLSDGQTFTTGTPFPDSVSVVAGVTTLIWNLGNLVTGTQGSISFSAVTNTSYVSPPTTVSAFDTLTNNVTENGTNANFLTPTPDSSGVTLSVAIPFLTKQILNYYYKDGTPKTITTVAPGDFVEFRLNYNASAITAEQRNILIDDFFPFNMGPLTGIPITYGGTVPAPPPPVTIDPHGLRWTLGTLPANSTFIATFRVQVENINFTGSLNNLGKLSGNNTAGLAYSDRDQVAVNFGQPNITLTKSVTGPDVNAIKAGETYTYSITIANPQNAANTTVDAFDIDLTDVIPTGLTYVPGTISVAGTGTFNPPSVIGQNVLVHILKLPPAGTLNVLFNVTVDASIPAGATFTNNANSTNPYSQPFTGSGDFQYSGLNRHAETTLRSKGVTLTKTPTPLFAKIGDTVTYIITATVPQGTSAYNLQVVDNYPSATQLYLDNATKDGSPITPTNVPGTVTFPVIPLVTAVATPVNIVYTFDVRVTGGTHVSPFIENQIDSATVSWELSPGVPAAPFTVTAPLQVRTPNLTSRKEQRNLTTRGVYTTTQVNYSPGDTIQYRLSLTNTGAETAFNTVLTDVLNPLLSFVAGSFSANLPSTPSIAGNTITWTIPQIAAGFTATLSFSVLTLPGVPSFGTIPDNASYIYYTNDNGFGINYGTSTTNTVTIRSPRVTINKTSSLTVGEIGDDITYTLTVVVPAGTIAYKLTVDDTLPTGQTYIGPATRQVLPNPAVVIPTSVIGQSVSFLDGNPNIDASAGAVTIVYTFIARIASATHNPPYSETQTDTGRVRWALTSGGSLNQSNTATRTITARTPNITVLKEQSNITTGVPFTTAPISGLPGNEIQYRFTITSNGASPAYNIILQDILNGFLTYNGVVSVSTGTVTPPGASLVWNIPVLNNGTNAVLIFSTIIASGIGAGGSISDQGTATYDSNDINPITYNASSNQVTLTIPALTLTKSAIPAIAAIGDTITYTLTVNIPFGVAAHNLVVTDVIPSGQSYVPGSWSPGPPPVVLFNKLTYTDPVTPLIGPLTLTFTFQTTVISGTLTPPFTEIQTNSASIAWNITPGGPSAPPVGTTFDVEIRSPHLSSLKEQRLTPAGTFSTDPLLGIVSGNVVEYRVTLTNNGTGTAYNVSTTDVLDPSLTYQGVVPPAPPGSVVSSVPPGTADGTITWSGFSIAPGTSVSLVFSVLVNAGFPPGSRVTDQSNTLYTTNPAGTTTLGPVTSNEVAFNFTNPLISKSVSPSNVSLGDTVTYTVVMTIPKGNIAYNVQVTDSLPPTQTYVPNSLTRNTMPVPSPTLVFPPEGTIDATGGDVTITYTFQATVTSLAVSPQDIQVDSAAVNWTLDPAGLNPGPPQTATATVYATDSNITISKEQKNVSAGGAYTSGVIQGAPGDQVSYRLTVSNPGINPIFNIKVTDPLSIFLQFNGIVTPPTAGVIAHNGVNPDGTVTWDIATIPPGTTYQAEFSVLVQPGVGSDTLIPDLAQAIFNASSTTPSVIYGPRISNTVLLQTPSIQFAKSIPSNQIELGTIFPYTLTVTVPAGLIAYNLVVTDTLPAGQDYADNATRNGLPVVPTVSGQTVTFPIETVDASAGQVTINYSFSARVTTGNLTSPFTLDQTNTATVNWNSDPFGTPAEPLSDSKTITVTSPFSFLNKVQRNVTQGTGYITSELDVAVGDIVRYRLRINSAGASPAYNVVVTDILGPFKQFMGIVEATVGSASGDGTVTWTIPVLPPGAEEFLIFDVQILAGISAGGTDSNTASEVYDTNPTTPITLGPTSSNTVVLKYPNVSITKTADKLNAAVGDIITYFVTFVLPKGTVAYNGQFTDTFPVGQNYNNNAALNGVPILPDSVIGQVVTFPAVPFAEAGPTDLNFVYSFQTQIVSANINPITFIDIQTDEAVGHWDLSPGIPAPPVNAMLSVNVTLPPLTLSKSASPAIAAIGDTVTYTLTVTVPFGVSAYNLVVTDVIPSGQSYVPGSWSPGPPPVVFFNKLTYTDPVTPRIGPLTLTYTFQTTVISGLLTPPFTEIQTDTAGIVWDITPTGPSAPPVGTIFDEEIRSPHLTSLKEQRLTPGGSFTTGPLLGIVTGNILEYRITLTNDGSGTAFNVRTTDILDPSLTYLGVVAPAPPGSVVSSVPPGTPDGTITWSGFSIAPGSSVGLVFSVLVNAGFPPGSRVADQANTLYDTNSTGALTLGPVPSNEVAFNYTNPLISKTVDRSNVFLGDTVTYTVVLTIPAGNIAYNVQVTDSLPATQTYVPNSLTRNTLPVPSPTLIFPFEGTIDAAAGEVTITYSFQATITSLTTSPQDIQINSSTVDWTLDPGGLNPGVPQTVQVTVYATNSDVSIIKEQKNDTTGGTYTLGVVQANPGNVVSYRLTIGNPSLNPIFNVVVTDSLSPFLQFNGIAAPPPAGVLAHNGVNPGGTVTWNIAEIPAGTTYQAEFTVLVQSGVVSDSQIPDTAQATFNATFTEPLISYGPRISNTVFLQVPPLTLTKSATPAPAAIGDTITYTLKVNIPLGVVVHNLVVTDVIPSGQSYVPGSWSPGPPPVVFFNKLTYTDPVTPLVGPLTLEYSFQTTVISGTLTPPFTEIQTNSAQIVWDLTPAGPPAQPVGTTLDVEIRSPNLSSLKEQRLTPNGSFTTEPLLGIVTGDVLEYRITLTNNGAGTAYNIRTTDVLDPSLTYLGVIPPAPPGSVVSSVPPGSPDGTLTWNGLSLPPALGPGSTATLVFSVLVNAGFPPGSRVADQANTLYDTNSTGALTLGPVPSNEVAFNYTNPLISKTVSPSNVFLGDTVTYTVVLTIPAGNIAYNVQVTDSLPPTQTYVPNSLTRNTLPVPSPTLVFPSEGTIDATGGAVAITYTFQATVTSLAVSPQDVQINSATVNWTLDPGGLKPGEPQTAQTTVYATDSDLTIVKEQKNNTTGGTYTTGVVQAVPGNEVSYRLTVSNPSLNPIFNVVVTDLLDPFLQFNAIVAPPPAGVLAHNGVNPGGTVTWSIAEIPSGVTYQAEFTVLVLPGILTEGQIPDTAHATFNATFTEPLILYGPRTSNTVFLQTPSFLQFTKSAPSSQIELGTVFPYTLTVTVPTGLIAYELVVSDTLPTGQEYMGNATRNGLPISPIVSGQVVTFPTEPIVDGTAGQVTITYAFSVRVITGNLNPPYIVKQTNNATLTWNIDPFGTPGTPLMDSQTITVTSPFSSIDKEQMNVTQGTGFVTTELPVNVGDIVRYRIRAASSGASPAYNLVVTDLLGPYKKFIAIVQTTAGSATGNGTVTWTIPSIAPGADDFLIFDVQILGGISAGNTDSNTASDVYDTNSTTPFTLGPTFSNTVFLRYPNISITKTADKLNAAIGNIITYTVALVLPRGTVAYNIQFIDTIPAGQNYNNQATLNGSPISPQSVLGLVVTFPVIPFASADGTDLILTYSFQTLVVSANVDPVTLTETQTDEATGHWFLDPVTPGPVVDSRFSVTVTNSSVQISKTQRNATRGEIFISQPINAVASDIIEYQLTITNNGPNTVYNVVALDNLSVNLKFLSNISVPIGTLNHSGGSFNGTVTFTVPTLASGESATAVFSVQVLSANVPQIANAATGTFRITPSDPTEYPTDPSNILIIEVGKELLANLVTSECIIVDKVYSQCQKRMCFERITITRPDDYILSKVVFHPGIILPGSLEITPIANRPNYQRVKFVVSVPYTATFSNSFGNIITEDFTLPDFVVDTILYLPATRSENTFKILITTRSTLLTMDSINAIISAGVILVISAVAQVQLLIPSAGFCSDVCDCEDFIPEQNTTCVDFLDETKTVFPMDFYPPKSSDC